MVTVIRASGEAWYDILSPSGRTSVQVFVRKDGSGHIEIERFAKDPLVVVGEIKLDRRGISKQQRVEFKKEEK